MAETTKSAEATIKKAVESVDVPKIYTNGFSIGLSNADIFIVFQRFGPNPVAVVNLSYTLAKTLAQRLGQVVSEFERAIDQTILTTDRIDEAAKKAQAKAQAEQQESTPKRDEDVH